MENVEKKNLSIDIDAYYEKNAKQEGWNKEDFTKIVLELQSMDREQLVFLCKQPNIKLTFTSSNWENTVPEEEMILALIADCNPQILKDTVEKL
ncbi:MAG: hypothetical protein M1320_00240 [Patescibacteria group bacterium]|nr:hypothetical protein [Patescibacteria group bacterium]